MPFARLCPFPRRPAAGLVALLALIAAARAQDPSTPNTLAGPLPREARSPIFFPPFPPALDHAINRLVVATTGTPAPKGLAQYAGEIFYPQVGSHLLADSLRGPPAAQLADYRAARRALATEIEQMLDATRDDAPDTRRAKLQALAQRQAPRLAALEKSAEHLRGQLIAADRNWSDFREWRLGDRERRGFSPLEIGQVMRAYAHYQKGFLPQQRRLLREIAAELALAAETAEKAAAASPYVFFSPEPARVTLPPEASAPVAAKITAYLSKKAVLKKELYDAVYAHDGQASIFNNPLRGMAEKQAPALAEIETLAEEIRVGLAPLTTQPPALPRSPLPQALVEKFSALAQRRAAQLQEANAKLDAARARIQREGLPVRLIHRFDDSGLKFTLVPLRDAAGGPRLEALHAEISQVSEVYGRALAEQINESLALREEAAALLGNTDPRALDHAIGQSVRLAAQRELAEPYRRYRSAVFEPGLSPEQRRLLFDVTVEALQLPLPRGELQPQRRGNSW